jgi:hypothetical protein
MSRVIRMSTPKGKPASLSKTAALTKAHGVKPTKICFALDARPANRVRLQHRSHGAKRAVSYPGDLNGDRTAACSTHLSRPRQRPAANRNPQARSDASADTSIAYGVTGHQLVSG